MNTPLPTLRYFAVFLVLAVIGIALRLYCLVAIPLERLIELWITDDAFYYFVTAENWARGFPSSFDTEHFTNGYHPLWMMLSVAVFWIAGGAGPAAVKFMLVVAFGFQLATALLIVALGQRIWNESAPAWLAGGIFLILPSNFILAFNGLESSLGMILLAAFFWASLRGWDEKRFDVRQAALCGILAGLTFLARTDQIFYLLGVWGLAFVFGPAQARLWVIWTGLTALAVVAPWLLWNYMKTGHIVQASASAYPMIIIHHMAEYLNPNTFWNRLPYLWPLFFRVVKEIVPGVVISHRVFWVALAGTIALMATAHAVRPAANRQITDDAPSARPWLLLVPLIGLLALMIVHGLIRAYPRFWYFAGAAIWGALAAGEMYRQLRLVFGARWLPGALMLALAAIGFWPQIQSARGGFFLNQGFHRQAALWVNANLPEGARIGAFNAGVFNYYCDRHVINLDGTTNNAALPPLRDKTMWSYIVQERIAYLVDAKFSIEDDYRIVMDMEGYPDSVLERMARIEHTDPNFEFYVYRVKGDDGITSPLLRSGGE